MQQPESDRLRLTQMIKAEAENLGFSLVGVTNPISPDNIKTYLDWIKENLHGCMDYLARDYAIRRRMHPATNLEGCTSIIVLGLPYPGPLYFSKPQDNSFHGRISSYAWGLDYHKIAKKKAHLLVELIKEYVPDNKFRIFVDSSPVLERDLAQRAGLGWIGKNTCLISPRKGSYFFLAEIFTTVELEQSKPFTDDRCGTCTRCIDICPTHCILSNRTIDASRCISYLTIEYKSDIPLELQPALGQWIFGCDLCQIVCPWNKKHNTQAGDEQIFPKKEFSYPDIAEEILLSPGAFEEKYQNSPVKRANRSGYMRNVAVALGNQAGIESNELILKVVLRETDPLVRKHLIGAFARNGGKKARTFLNQCLKSEKDSSVVSEIELLIKRL